MSTNILIEHRKPVPNRWRIREATAQVSCAGNESETAQAPCAGNGSETAQEIVPLVTWRTLRGQLPGDGDSGHADGDTAPIGVLLEPDEDPRELQADLDRLALIAVRFPVFTDGRGYSVARVLRQQLRWTGPLMAVGDVLRDQLLLLERCGFDTFWLREDQSLDEALSAFGDFSEAYQATAARVPLFERRGSLASGAA